MSSATGSGEDPLQGLAEDLATSPYEPLQFLARGGMGEVVVVRHRELGRKLVMKLLRSNLQGQEQLAERMRAEARMLARLAHPNLVAVVDSGRTAGGRPFLVTELLEGETLSEYTAARGGHLPVREALAFATQILAGLSVVHEAGFVHRDLKPANLFVLRGASPEARRIKILDFGIAKALSEDDRRALGMVAATAEGSIMGTPSFVSPEQVQSGKVDARTDLYGLGIVLFRLITGKAPFTGDALALFRAHLLESPPTASSIGAQPVPADVDRLLMKVLEKDPGKRFQSASEMARAIERVLVGMDLEGDATEDASHALATTVVASGGTVSMATPPGQSAAPESEPETTTSAYGAHVAGGTAVIPTMTSSALASSPLASSALASSASLSPSVAVAAAPAPVSAAARSMGAMSTPSPAAPPRRTELIQRAHAAAPRDTVRLDAPEPMGSPWRASAPPRRSAPQPPMRAPAPSDRGALATWGPVLFAVVAAVVVLLLLFAWKSR